MYARHLGPAEVPVVERTFNQRRSVRTARASLAWAFVNLLLALFLYLEITHGTLLEYFNLMHPVAWYAEVGLAVVFAINTLWDVVRYLYLGLAVSASPVVVTDAQRALLAVNNQDVGFRSPVPLNPTMTAASISPGSVPIYSPSAFTSHASISGMSSMFSPPHLTPGSSPSMYRPGSSHSIHSHHSPSPTGQYSLDRSGSFTGAHGSGSGSPLGGSFLEQSMAYTGGQSTSFSTSFPKAGSSPLTPLSTLSPLFRETSYSDTSQTAATGSSFGLRSRVHSPAVMKASPGRREDCISDMKALEEFLQEQDEKERKAQMAADTSTGAGPSFWSYNRSFSDYSPLLRKYQYQIACRSPQSAKSASKDDDVDESVTYSPDQVWQQVGVHVDDADRWVANLRKWLRSTILQRVVEEIDRINRQLVRVGCDDMQIGEVSISTLKQLGVTKSHQVPSLNGLVPFLEASTNQEYLVHRIKELASGGCMSPFKWNGGGEFKGKAWGEHLPTDSAIVMHLLCTYMDSRMPPHPKFPDGKTFTNQHYIKTPDKPDLEKKDNLCIFQSAINPPHFKVVLQDDIWNPRKGRNNFFHAVLLFFHHIRTKEHNMLGRVNLGLSGINVCWIFEQH